jgi:hypothetical protein
MVPGKATTKLLVIGGALALLGLGYVASVAVERLRMARRRKKVEADQTKWREQAEQPPADKLESEDLAGC